MEENSRGTRMKTRGLVEEVTEMMKMRIDGGWTRVLVIKV